MDTPRSTRRTMVGLDPPPTEKDAPDMLYIEPPFTVRILKSRFIGRAMRKASDRLAAATDARADGDPLVCFPDGP